MGEPSDRLFVPLKTGPFRWFQLGAKEWELRAVNPNFNPETVYVGRHVELRHGYNGDSLWGVIREVATADDLRSVLDRVPFEKISPAAGSRESARDHIGEHYDEEPDDGWITFRPNNLTETPQVKANP